MDQWLDSLSEDWVSQPRSQSPRSSLPASPIGSNDGSQSRIPRSKATSMQDRRGYDNRKGALKARTPSQINSSSPRSESSAVKSSRSENKRVHHKFDESVRNPNAPAPLGTVQQRASPTRVANGQATPEWKRRLVNGKGNAKEATDLLSPKPVGLEGVFKPPTIKRQQVQKDVGKRRPLLGEKNQPNGKANQGSSSSQPEKVSPKQVACYDDPCEQDRRLGKPAEGVDTQRHTSLGIQDASIMASDQSQSDGFSPAVLSKQVTANGQIHFTATPSPKKRPSIDGGKTQWSPTHPPPFPCEGLEAQHPVQTSALDQSTANQDMPIITSQSLPDDLSVGTDEFAARGGYVSLKRGGYSEEGSFQSMPLSSSAGNFDGPSLRGRSAPLPDERSFPAENALQDDSLVSPRTPELGYAVVQSSPERPRSSGSPLKLFDKYDTFTNDRLLRRMSKFEETMAQGEQSVLDADNSSKLSTPPPGPKRGAQVDLSHGEPNADSSRVSSFGDGALDNYIFPDPPAQEPRLPQLPRMTSQYTSTETPRKRQQSKTRPRRFSQSNHVQHSTRNHSEAVHEPPDDSTTRQGANSIPKQGSEAYQTAHGKRLRGSPAKGSSPKRRRTLQNPENSLQIDVAAQVTVSESQSTPSKSLVGRKRKDARYEQGEKLANPEILAMRQMRRPRNPTPSQASSSTRQSPSIYIDETPQSTPKKANSQSDADIEAPVQFLADVLATNALNTAQHMASSRKPSVTTADYFNEAQQIMSLIRAEKRPHSSHETMNQSRIGQQTIYEESWLAESTMEQFSRPPSRDGSVPSRTRDLPSVDVRAVSQLQRFEDKDDLGLALSTSVKTLKLNRSRSQSDAFVVHKAFVEDSHGESDPPNVRIRARTEGVHQLPQAGHRRNDSEKSNDSKRSIPTRSSGSSTNRMVIAPENVAHLLSDRMAGMMFDRQRQMWVKSKTQEAAPKDCQADREEDSEENILGDIPDLSVNEMEELQRVRDAVSAGQTFRSLHVDVDTNDHATGQQPDNAVYPKERDSDFRPRTADGKSIPPMEDSSAPSKYSHFASSGPVPSTRATSWGDEVWSAKTLPAQAPGLPPVAEVADHASVEEVEREISILEGRVAEPLNHVHQPPRKTRVVTVSFSSPPVDRMHSPDIRETWQNKAHDCETETPSRQDLISPNQSTFRQTDRKPSRRSLSRRMSLDIQARSMSRVDEDEEMSVVQYSVTANRTLDIAISTPLPIARSLGPPSSISRSSIGFQLSPLPDFTINQIDRPLDAEAGVLAKLPDSQAMSTPSSRISLTAQDLIKHLTDLEPYEPYWEYIQMMDLKNRGLSSLHMLDDLCNHVAHLDVSNNHLRELNGLPASVRLLKIQDNCLSDLSAWHHLQNLQYLDVSGNDLTSLKGLWGLHHLRALRADDDGLESLAGIEGLDGLLSLSVQGNRLSKVDFEDFDLARLVDLDMSNNSISEILNIHRLPNLKSLDIADNDLQTFAPSSIHPCIEDLNLSYNNLSTLDILSCPSLRCLNIDNNSIATLKGLPSLSNVSHLSSRAQRQSEPLAYSFLHEVHHLYLSSNPIPTFTPQTSFLNLRSLELASCGLHTLSQDFGNRCPNIRSLNLNYNALKSLVPLLGIMRLERLSVADNRVSKLRQTAAVLDQLGASVTQLDFRNNPLTLGFYIPVHKPVDEKDLIVHNSRSEQAQEADGRWKMQFLLPVQNSVDDESARLRLDEATMMRRRVYEMLIIHTCEGLTKLDGLEVDRGIVKRRDEVWKRLNDLGVLKKVGPSNEDMASKGVGKVG